MSIAVKKFFDHKKVKYKSIRTKVNNKSQKNQIQKTSLTRSLNSEHFKPEKRVKRKNNRFLSVRWNSTSFLN